MVCNCGKLVNATTLLQLTHSQSSLMRNLLDAVDDGKSPFFPPHHPPRLTSFSSETTGDESAIAT